MNVSDILSRGFSLAWDGPVQAVDSACAICESWDDDDWRFHFEQAIAARWGDEEPDPADEALDRLIDEVSAACRD